MRTQASQATLQEPIRITSPAFSYSPSAIRIAATAAIKAVETTIDMLNATATNTRLVVGKH